MYDKNGPIATPAPAQWSAANLDNRGVPAYLVSHSVEGAHNSGHEMIDTRIRTAIVTGGTGALGSVVARKLAEHNVSLALPVRQQSSVAELHRIFPLEKVFAAVADLEDESEVNSFVAGTLKHFGTVEVLVNLAGGYAGGNPIERVTVDEWEGMMNLNLRTVFLTCRAVLPIMRQQSYGRIVNIAAMPALTSGANKGPYAISKRGVISLTETIADETKGTGITANALTPSIILTEANKKSMPGADFSKWVTPEDIAEMIVSLISRHARSISGNVIKMYGGV